MKTQPEYFEAGQTSPKAGNYTQQERHSSPVPVASVSTTQPHVVVYRDQDIIIPDYDAKKSINLGAAVIALSIACWAFTVAGMLIQVERSGDLGDPNWPYLVMPGLWAPILVRSEMV